MSLVVVPINITEARKHDVERHHSHHHAPQGGLCAVAVAEDSRVVCVAMLSRPVARMLNADPLCAEVNRVASDGSAKHAASMAVGAISRAAFALGYRRLISYLLLGEAGTSYISSHLLARIRERRATYDGPDAATVRAYGLVPCAPWQPPTPEGVAAVAADVTAAQRACEAMAARAAGRPAQSPRAWEAAAARLDAALAALPAIEAATATGRRGDVVAALEPLAAALRGERG